MLHTIELIATACNMIPSALADSATSGATSPPNYGAPGLIFFLIAYLSRKREIGGWLLLYYMGLYMGSLLSIALLAATIGNLAPSQWAGVPAWKYALGIASTFLPTGALVAEVIAGTRLLSRRTPERLHTLRRVLLMFLAADVLALAIDLTVFRTDSARAVMEVYSFIVGSIWLAYFYKSVRVQAVFVTHTWTHLATQDVATTAAELKYVKRRAWITFGTIAALFSVLGASLAGSEGLGLGILCGLFWGAIGGYIARNMSISKGRKEWIAANAITAETLVLEDSPPRSLPAGSPSGESKL